MGEDTFIQTANWLIFALLSYKKPRFFNQNRNIIMCNTITKEFWQRVYANYSQGNSAFICLSDSAFKAYWTSGDKFKNECFRLRDIFLKQYKGEKSFLIEDTSYKYLLFNDDSSYYKRREIRSEFLKWMIENHHLFNF